MLIFSAIITLMTFINPVTLTILMFLLSNMGLMIICQSILYGVGMILILIHMPVQSKL